MHVRKAQYRNKTCILSVIRQQSCTIKKAVISMVSFHSGIDEAIKKERRYKLLIEECISSFFAFYTCILR